jgi:hypothetical protein
MMSSRDVEATAITPDAFHFLPVLAHWFSLCNPHLLEKDVRRIKDARSVSSISTFVATEFGQLARLDLRWLFLAMVLIA